MYERRVKCVYSVLIDKHIVSSTYMDEYWINILFIPCTSVHVIGTYRRTFFVSLTYHVTVRNSCRMTIQLVSAFPLVPAFWSFKLSGSSRLSGLFQLSGRLGHCKLEKV
jgi:hypothetical protein